MHFKSFTLKAVCYRTHERHLNIDTSATVIMAVLMTITSKLYTWHSVSGSHYGTQKRHMNIRNSVQSRM